MITSLAPRLSHRNTTAVFLSFRFLSFIFIALFLIACSRDDEEIPGMETSKLLEIEDKKSFYISPSGNDSNSGTSPQEAWRTLSQINDMDIPPGYSLLLEGSHTYEESLYLDSLDGNNPENPVKISSYGQGRATIAAGQRHGIYAYNTSGFLINNLIVAGDGMDSNTGSGIYFFNDLSGNVKLDKVEITNCEIYGFRDFGIAIVGDNNNSGFTNVKIEGNRVHHILDAGITSIGDFSPTKAGYAHAGITVKNCEVFDIKGYDKNGNSGNGIVLSDVQNSVIEYCTVYDCGSGNTHCGGPVGIWYWDADQVTIQHCEAYNIRSGTGCDGGGFDLDGGVTNGLMQYNYSHNNDGAGFLAGQFPGARPMENITIRFNISQNDANTNGGSLYLFNGGGTIKNIQVYNNTFYLEKQSGNPGSAIIKYLDWQPLKENINFYNNILYAANNATLIDLPSGYDGNFAGNLYHSSPGFEISYKGSTYGSLVDFRSTGNEYYDNEEVGYQGDPALSGAGTGGIIGFGNPLPQLSAYRLHQNSPAADTGIQAPVDKGDRDFYQNHLLQNTVSGVGAHAVSEENW